MTDLTESRVLEIINARVPQLVNQELDRRSAGAAGAGYQQPQQDPTPTTVDSGRTYVASIDKWLPNRLIDPQGNKEGPMAYVSRIALLLANNDADKARELVNDLGVLAPQGPGAASYGFTDDDASFPQAAVTFAVHIFAKPGAGNVGR